MKQAKTLGGIGAILMIAGVLGGIGIFYAGLASLIGVILVLAAFNWMADYYQERGIFNIALYGLILIMVGVVIFAAIIVAVAQTTFSSAGIVLTYPLAVLEYMTLENLGSTIGRTPIAMVALFMFLLASAVFLRKSLNSLSAKSGEKTFGWAGLLCLIGAIPSIVTIGLILIFISWILITLSFFFIKK